MDRVAETPRVLVVEPDPGVHTRIVEVLNEIGYAVDSAESADQFRASVGRQAYHVVLVDETLPDGSGLDVIQRHSGSGGGPAFVMLSQNGDTARAVAAMRAGALDYLSSPSEEGFFELLPVVLGNVVERIRIRDSERMLQRRISDTDRKLSDALRASPIPTLLVDASGALHLVNRAWRDSLGVRSSHGFTLESLLNATFLDPEAVQEALRHARDRVVEQIVGVTSKGDTPRTWKLTITPLTRSDEEHEPQTLYVCHGLDITDTIELERRLRSLALEDPLTGLPNRRSLQAQLPAEVARSRRDETVISVAMIDIDHFKAYNDLHGHLAGDRCLVQVARTIRNAMRRPADYVARFGGEEFAVILPGVEASGAHQLLEHVRRAIEELETQKDEAHTNEAVTVSIGIACSASFLNPSADQLLHAADGALFAAKGRGRNTIELHPAES